MLCERNQAKYMHSFYGEFWKIQRKTEKVFSHHEKVVIKTAMGQRQLGVVTLLLP
jgi:hypothetical protein